MNVLEVWTFFSLIMGDWHAGSSQREIMAHQKSDFMSINRIINLTILVQETVESYNQSDPCKYDLLRCPPLEGLG